MANPTVQVQQVNTNFDNTEKYFPISNASTTFYPGEMIGLILNATTGNVPGNATHFDDTQALKFLGVFMGPQAVIDSTVPAGQLYIRVKKAYYYSMPAVSGTPTSPTDVGTPVYAANSGQVQKTLSGLNNANLAGVIIGPYVPGGPTPSSGQASTGLTGTAAQGWYITPTRDTAADSLIVSNKGTISFGTMPTIPIFAEAATGSNQATANALSPGFNLVASANGSLGVILPATPIDGNDNGKVVIVKNNAGGGALLVYPGIGCTINALAANTNYNIANYAGTMFIGYSATAWYSIPLVAS